MVRSDVAQNPLVPASYDIVWSAVMVGVLVLLVLAVIALVRMVRRPSETRRVPLAGDAVERVRQLAQLRDEGAITTQEYEARMHHILGPV